MTPFSDGKGAETPSEARETIIAPSTGVTSKGACLSGMISNEKTESLLIHPNGDKSGESAVQIVRPYPLILLGKILPD